MDLFLTRQDRHYESASEHLIEDALVLLEKARQAGLEQVLVTNREHAQRLKASPHTIVQNSVLAQAIGMVLAGDEVTHRKPDARVLEGFLDMHELRPEEVLVIGDQFVDGLLALNMGTRAILVVRNGDTIPNLERMGEGWQDHVTLVRSLHEVEL
jgi:phosphoglycolate phosphatase-like HAD superfamily hydrolase